MNFLLMLVVAVLATTVVQQSGAIGRLSSALTGQRDQFDTCRGKPASTPGCTAPVAAEPSVIVKQGTRGPVGLTGAMGPMGPTGPRGPMGPPGAMGPMGLPGNSPRCLLETTRCVGAAGKAGKDGKDGAPGKNGADGKNGVDGKDGAPGTNGVDGKNGADGAPGAMGPQGNPGRGIQSTSCVNGRWVVTYTDGTQEEPQGTCVAVGP
jgi:hypothetical protein